MLTPSVYKLRLEKIFSGPSETYKWSDNREISGYNPKNAINPSAT